MLINPETWPKVLPLSNQATVETFYLPLQGLSERGLEASPLVDCIEAQLLQALPQTTRLLRWALVKRQGSVFWCEGAYLQEAI